MSLLNLPVEILHSICDRLDVLTIVGSFRYVCKYLYDVTDSYNRYTINITSISESALTSLSTRIRPESIISLTFSDADYLKRDQSIHFCSVFDISRLTTLHSLALYDGTDNDRQNVFSLILFGQVRRDFQHQKNDFSISLLVSKQISYS